MVWQKPEHSLRSLFECFDKKNEIFEVVLGGGETGLKLKNLMQGSEFGVPLSGEFRRFL